MKLCWSHRLEALAERLYEDVAASRGDDPFARSCVVVGHSLRGDWLREFRLFERPDAARPVLANLDVVPLHPFVGDWLYAAVERKDPKERRPSAHPYSRDVMQWRVDAVLARRPNAFPVLAGYLGEDPEELPSRRFALAGRIAESFDDYQAHRPEMLERWERGPVPPDPGEAWQAELWRELRGQRAAGESLVEQFLAVGRGSADLAGAFAHGVPRYRSVHVFGVSSMPRPHLAFFERLSAVVPVFVYAFNPSAAFWFDDPSWARARREAVEEARMAALRGVDAALARGETPDLRPLRERLAEKAHPLLGSLATGGQGLLAELLDRLQGNYEPLGDPPEGETLLARLQRQLFERNDADERDRPVAADDDSLSVHLASTPHREMEIVKDGLLDWFARHPGARPRDVLVLCADWAKYAPHVEAVFGTGGDGEPEIPFSLPARPAAQDPVAAAFLSLLELSGGRFEADAVLDALAVPAVAARFGISESDFPALRELVRGANVRWGLDDAHVESVMRAAAPEAPAAPEDGAPFPFTWRRGLDRLLLSALAGPLDAAPEGLARAGRLGTILPADDPESDRASLVGRLASFVGRLGRLRDLRREEGTASFWEDRLMGAISDFFEPTDDNHRAIAALREAVATVTARMREADAAAGSESRHGFAVVADAVSAHLSGESDRPVRTPDAVLFAPLRAGVPSPRRFVWICGMNDGAFPRNAFRPAFDRLGAHPAPLDPSPREDDAFALLEAVCAARETLAVSHLGIDPRTDANVPPAPLLGALEDYLKDRFARAGAAPEAPPFLLFRHPLQAFSSRYFLSPGERKGGPLPPSRSVSAFRTAEAIARAERRPGGGTPEPFVFLTRDEIDLADLVQAFAAPCRAVLRRMAFVADPERDVLPVEDELGASSRAKWDKLFLSERRSFSDEDARAIGAADCERGLAVRPEDASSAYLEEWGSEARAAFRDRTVSSAMKKGLSAPVPAPEADRALDLLEACAAAAPRPVRLDLPVPAPGGGTRTIRLSGTLSAVPLPTADGGEALFRAALSSYIEKPAAMARNWLLHLVGNAAFGELETLVFSGEGAGADKKQAQLYPPLPQAEAKARVAGLLAILLAPHAGGIPFHPQASADLAGWEGTPPADKADEALRKPFSPAIRRGAPPAPPKLEDRTLWPEPDGTPASLPPEGRAEWIAAAHAFWDGFPYLTHHRAPKAAKKDRS